LHQGQCWILWHSCKRNAKNWTSSWISTSDHLCWTQEPDSHICSLCKEMKGKSLMSPKVTWYCWAPIGIDKKIAFLTRSYLQMLLRLWEFTAKWNPPNKEWNPEKQKQKKTYSQLYFSQYNECQEKRARIWEFIPHNNYGTCLCSSVLT
jgi:hypothetical protein